MRHAWLIPLALAGALVWPVVTAPMAKTIAQETPPPPADDADAEGTEVLTRGPIHEAFAEPVTEPEPTLVVPKKPPEDIEEVPPEYAPEAEDAIWINGYWAWDDDRDDFIWVSGVYRVPPPGMRWVPGYWAEADGGWQWNRGFWVSTEAEELAYRDPPPPSEEVGPSSPSPGNDYYYVPGNWNYYDTGYRWSPGYWSVYRPGWCWVPARWVWTPRGCIFLPGYYDYSFVNRGFCYAPVYFNSPVYARPGYFYRPWYGLNLGNLFVHFWIRPRYCHYYFGNYYANYNQWGMTPWYSYYGGGYYDPLLSFNVVHFRTRGINYVDRIGGWHRYYDRHVADRPPVTLADQRRLATQLNITNITQINKVTNVSAKQNFLAGNVKDLAKMEAAPVRLRQLTAEQKDRATQRAKQVSRELGEVRKQRHQIERVAKADLPERGPDGVKGEKGAKGTDAGAKGTEKGAKGPDGVAKGKAGVDLGAKGRPGGEVRGETRARMKLPQSQVAVEQPRIAVPERPDRSPPGDGQAGGKTRGPKGPDRSARTPDGQKSDLPDRAKGPDRTTPPSIDRGKAKGKGKGTDVPGVEAPGVDRPDRPRVDRSEPKPELPRVDRGGDQPRPGSRVGVPEGGRPDRSPRPGGDRPSGSKGKGSPRSSERPNLELPGAEPKVERPAPRTERPEPKIDRPPARVERPEPRVDRPEPRLDRPPTRIDRPAPGTTPRVDRPEPRVERPSPPPRVERSGSEARVERSLPRSSSRPANSTDSSRGASRSRDRDRDQE